MKRQTQIELSPGEVDFYRAVGEGNISRGLGICLDAVNSNDDSYLDVIASVLNGEAEANEALVMGKINARYDATCDQCGVPISSKNFVECACGSREGTMNE